jgi:hypothetical protein
MAKQGNEENEPTLGGALQSLFVAGVRMSAGLTLYGLEQIRNTAEAIRGDGLAGAAGKLGSALDRLSDTMEDGIDDTKKEALRSISRVTAKAVEKYAEILSPSAIAEAANQLMKKSGASGSSLSGTANRPARTAPDRAPQLATDVLTGPPDT